MSNCVCGVFNCLSATVLCIIRVILFVGCVLMTLSSALGLWALYMVDTRISDLAFPGVDITLRSYIMEAFILVVSIMGAHGTYSKNPKYLKLFALFITIYSLIHFFVVADELSGTDWPKQNEQFVKLMTDYAKTYQFDLPVGAEPNKGTRAWNVVQSSLLCCGLNKPSDWTKGPLHKGGEDLPRSCCLNFPRAHDNSGKCTIKSMEVFNIGCMERIDYILTTAFAHAVFKCFMYLLFAIFALILARKNNQTPAAVVFSSPAGGPVYERFGGSIYVRTNPSAAHSAPAQNQNYQKQPPVAPGNNLYPSMDLPPPSYTSS